MSASHLPRVFNQVRHKPLGTSGLWFRRAFSSTPHRWSADDDLRNKETTLSRGLPEIATPVEDSSSGAFTDEQIKERQSEGARRWLEEKVGKEKLELVKLLQAHLVVVRGGSEEGQRFIEALLEWKRREEL